ncbi:MAG: CinA family nicotinamide mononucleotide deamidase-related protein [Phycisphaerales bacterium]|nr:CinA family nicotinamide mononucleotide deamidase-related protein [Phycisphaerales bacterium]
MTSRAAILSIGDELTLGQIAQSNSGWIAQELLGAGVTVVEHRTVADDRTAIARAMKELASQVALVVATGGLGPTEDDLTREALADAMDCVDLVESAYERRVLEERFARRGVTMPLSNLRQACCPAGAAFLANPNGTAPGITARVGSAQLFCLPGPPHEMQPMFIAHVIPAAHALVAASGGDSVALCAVHSCGLPESTAAEKIRALMGRGSNPLVGTTASGATVTARIRASGSVARSGGAQRAACDVEQAWGAYVFGRDETSLSQALGELLRIRRESVALAESCTGGGIGHLITSASGSSEWFAGGWISYSNQFKREFLGVAPQLLQQHGAVSAPVARAMAVAAAHQAGVRWGLSATGIAGPTGATNEKPVGTVFIAVADRAADGGALAREFRFTGDRATIRLRAATIALQVLRLALLEQSELQLLGEVCSLPKNSP